MIPPTQSLSKPGYRRSYEIFAMVLYCFLSGPQTSTSIARRTKIKVYTVRRVLRSLHNPDHKCIYIKDWVILRTTPIPVYDLGKAEDLPRPSTTSTERKRRIVAKRKTLDRWVGL